MTTWPQDDIDRMVEMWKTGRSAAEIANALGHGVSRNSVIGRIARMGLNRKGPYERPRRLSLPSAQRVAIVVKARIEHKPPALTPADVLSPNARPWHERELRQCAWPVSGDGADTVSCANETEPGKTYCGAHLSLYSTPAKTNVLRMARRYA